MLKFRLDKRLVVDSTLFGVLLTLVVVAADLLGLLTPLELWLYDQRALRCQHWTPPPTDKLVHVDIDDAALESIGRWPWHRTVVADIVDEINLAKPKAVALDVLFSEPQDDEWRRLPNKQFVEIKHDKNLADALRRLDLSLLGASLPFVRETVSPVYADVRRILGQDPMLDEARVAAALRDDGSRLPNLDDLVRQDFYLARGEAIFERIELAGDQLPPNDVLPKVLPRLDATMHSPLSRSFKRQYDNAQAAAALRRLALPLPTGAPNLFPAKLKYAPIEPLGAAVRGGGFVDYPQSADGKVRAVPLFVESKGVMYPQLGLALACATLDVDPRAIRLSNDSLVIPRTGQKDVVVPVHTIASADLLRVDRDVPMAANVSWFGGRDWERMYDVARHAETKQHLPIAFIWDACLSRQKIVENNRKADIAMGLVMPDELFEKMMNAPKLADDDVRGFGQRITEVLAKVDPRAFDELPPDKQAEAAKAVQSLRNALEQNPKIEAELRQQRERLKAALSGRAVLIGWTAMASIADFLPTSLHARCPGVVLHGVIFNQIVNGEVWRTLPRWATLLTTIFLGLLTTLAVSILTPARALVAAAVLLAGYLLVNGFLLFDYGNLILGAAGPVVAIASVWSGGTLAKLGMERLERARITRRFRSYADPKLVDYVIKHPEENLFEGQVRELTVVFIDLVRFTDLTERLGAATVQLLNELWETLIPVIKQNDAYVNKFLGDGLMFLFGAPEQSPFHARDAIRTVFDVRKALARFNERATAKGWPPQALRFGISTGNMIVGDTGAPDGGRCDYSVIGDYANLGSRLESANKLVGTTTLMTERTVQLAGDGFLFRPIGKLCVVGKQASVMTYEVVARLDEATDAQRQLAADTKEMVDCFLAGRVKECLNAVDKMEAVHGPSKLTAIYRERCEYFLQDPPPAPFDCQIVLTEK